MDVGKGIGNMVFSGDDRRYRVDLVVCEYVRIFTSNVYLPDNVKFGTIVYMLYIADTI